MNITKNGIITQNKIFLWIAFVTGLILLLPLAAMQFTSDVNWNLFDFIVAGALIFGFGSVFILVARKFPKRRIIIGLIIIIAFIWLWAELAVGVFTNWGS